MKRTTHLAMAGLSAIAVAYGFARYGYGLFVPVFREEFALSTGTLGIISSAGYAAYLAAMIVTGLLAGRLGPRIPVVTGAACASVGMLLIATAQSPMHLIFGVVLSGSSPGFSWAPFSDAVAMMVDEKHHGRVLSIVSTGTSFGLTVAGPVFLLATLGRDADHAGWRYVWAAFAISALVVAVWCARLLPGTPHRNATNDTQRRDGSMGAAIGWFVCRRSAPLLAQAFVYGLIAAVYFTYAVDLVGQSGLGEMWGPILLSVVGVSGTVGVFTGDAVKRFGLWRCLVICLGTMATSIAALGSAGGAGLLVVASALLFGASYMPIAAMLVVWSGRVFRERPSTGFSAVLLSLALGSIVGPALLGSVAETFSLQVTFWCTAAMTAASTMFRPRSDIGDAT